MRFLATQSCETRLLFRRHPFRSSFHRFVIKQLVFVYKNKMQKQKNKQHEIQSNYTYLLYRFYVWLADSRRCDRRSCKCLLVDDFFIFWREIVFRFMILLQSWIVFFALLCYGYKFVLRFTIPHRLQFFFFFCSTFSTLKSWSTVANHFYYVDRTWIWRSFHILMPIMWHFNGMEDHISTILCFF